MRQESIIRRWRMSLNAWHRPRPQFRTPLMRVEHDGEYAMVASLGGAPNNSAWYHNLKQHPHVELQDGAVKCDYTAREVTGPEKALWWERAVVAFPDYAGYQKKTTWQNPVFVLTPMPDANLG